MIGRAGLGAAVLAGLVAASAPAGADEAASTDGDESGAKAQADPARTKAKASPAKKVAAADDQATPAALPPAGTSAPASPAPGAAPAASVPPATTAAAAGAPDVPAEEKKLPPRVPWRGTSLRWSNSVTTTALGVGRDNLGDSDEQYVMSWSLILSYYLVDQEKLARESDSFFVRLLVNPNWSVELTNAANTTNENEVWFGPLAVIGQFHWNVVGFGKDEAHKFGIRPQLGLIFPTDPPSIANGTILTLSPRLNFYQNLPLIPDSPVLDDVDLLLALRYDHRFSEATTPVSEDLERPRTLPSGEGFLSDQLSSARLTTDSFRQTVQVSFGEAFADMDLSLSTAFTFRQDHVPALSDAVVALPTGPAVVAADADATNWRHTGIFETSVEYSPIPELTVAFGYANEALRLGEDGQTRSFFYSPGAAFSGDLIVSFDAIYERITGPARKGAFYLADSKQPQKKRPPSRTTASAFSTSF
jgi:hypothetical protein